MPLTDLDVEQFRGLLTDFPGRRVAVIGDLVADSYVYGLPVRLSREAPVIILKHEREEFFPGGAANTVSNLLTLGAEVFVLGMVGDDVPGRKIIEHLETMGADVSGIICSSAWKTIAKSRILGGDYHTSKQQMLRIDQEPDRPPSKEELEAIEQKVQGMLGHVEAWVASDYGYHLATSPGIIKLMQTASAQERVVVADSRYRVREFCGLTLVTPNETELFSAYGIKRIPVDGTGESLVMEMGNRLLNEVDSKAVLVTRGNRGMVLFERGEEPRRIPIAGTSDIVDVSGAGDTVVAAAALALAGQSGLMAAARLSNIAAGVKVMKRGTVPVSSSELFVAMEKLRMNGGPAKN